MNTAFILIVWLTTLLNGAAIGIGVGYILWGRKKAAPSPALAVPSMGEEELERARKEREELIASQKAFQTMMGYNVDMVYGLDDDESTVGGI